MSKKLFVEVVESPFGRLVFLGAGSSGGTYVLKIRVHKRLRISFGRFKGGEKILVAPGDHLYVGSAIDEQGACCIAKRLVRLSRRTETWPSHTFRDLIRTDV